MVSRTQFAAVLCLGALAAAPALARDMGDPAFVFQMPDDWTSKIDEDGNLILNGGDHAEGFSLSHAKYEGDLDAFAAQVMDVAKGTLTGQKEAASIAQYSGTAYYATMTPSSGVDLKLKFVAVRIDPATIAAYTEILLSDATPAQTEAADAVARSITLTGP